MIRKLRTFTLALLAVACLGGLAAASSPAALFHSEAEPTTVQVNGTSSHVFTFNYALGTGNLTCVGVKLSGTQSTKTAESVTLSLFYEACTMLGFINVVRSTNGCNYRLWANNTMDIACPTAIGIQFSAAECTLTLVPQKGAKTVKYANNGKEVDVTFEAELAYTTSGGWCAAAPGTGPYAGTSKALGKNSGGTQVRYWYE